MSYLIPSKTFLVGEYSVLLQGSALGLSTKPEFQFIYQSQLKEKYSYLNAEQVEAELYLHKFKYLNIHPESPAGIYKTLLEKNIHFKEDIYFNDPFSEIEIQGGFGKSTAEFIAIGLETWQKNHLTTRQILDNYLAVFANEKNKPSGADLLTQLIGHVTYIDFSSHSFELWNWSFENLDFLIVPTGFKLKTHEHLKTLNYKKIEMLPYHSDQVIKAFEKSDSRVFLEEMSLWCRVLKSLDLTSDKTLGLIDEISKVDNVLLVKPCGALGADVVLVFFNSEYKENIVNQLNKINLKSIASSKDLVAGVMQYVD